MSLEALIIDNPPDNVIIGVVEVFAGLLLCIIPEPTVRAIGTGMVVHGVGLALGPLEKLDLGPKN